MELPTHHFVLLPGTLQFHRLRLVGICCRAHTAVTTGIIQNNSVGDLPTRYLFKLWRSVYLDGAYTRIPADSKRIYP